MSRETEEEQSWRCLGCGQELGRTTRRWLWLGHVYVLTQTTIICGACGRRRSWAPLKGIDKDVFSVYNENEREVLDLPR